MTGLWVTAPDSSHHLGSIVLPYASCDPQRQGISRQHPFSIRSLRIQERSECATRLLLCATWLLFLVIVQDSRHHLGSSVLPYASCDLSDRSSAGSTPFQSPECAQNVLQHSFFVLIDWPLGDFARLQASSGHKCIATSLLSPLRQVIRRHHSLSFRSRHVRECATGLLLSAT